MGIDHMQDKLIEELEKYSDIVNRFKYFRQLAKLGNELPPVQAADLYNVQAVAGNKRKIWLKASLENGKVFFTAHSKSIISKSLTALLLKVLSGRSPGEIINSNLYFLNEIKLYDRLNADWINDLLAVMQKIKSLTVKLQISASS